jgi:hypothetical protein
MIRAIRKEETIIQIFKSTIVATSLIALAGCAAWDKSPICGNTHGWLAWSDVRCGGNRVAQDMTDNPTVLGKDRQRPADDLTATQHQLADRDRELAVRDASLAKAEKDFLKSLQPEISKGTVSVH